MVKQQDSISFTPIVAIRVITYTEWQIWTCMRTKLGYNVGVKNSEEEVIDLAVTDQDILRIFGVKFEGMWYSQKR